MSPDKQPTEVDIVAVRCEPIRVLPRDLTAVAMVPGFEPDRRLSLWRVYSEEYPGESETIECHGVMDAMVWASERWPGSGPWGANEALPDDRCSPHREDKE